MARKAVKSVTFSGITGTYAVLSCTPASGSSVEVDAIAAFGDAGYTSVPRSVKSYGDVVLTLLDEGAALTNLENAVGTVVQVTLTVAWNSGADVSDTSRAVYSTGTKAVIISVLPGGDVGVDGEHKATVVVTMRQHAPAA